MAIRSTIAVTVCALALAACGGHSGAKAGQLSLGMVTDVGGLGDNAFNDSAHKGLLRAQEQLGANVTVLESNRRPIIRRICRSSPIGTST